MKNLGLIAITITWIAIFILIFTQKLGSGFSISKHAITNRRTYVGMALIETVMLSLFTTFIVTWFVPTLQLGRFFMILMIVAALGLVAAAWIPDSGDKKHLVHEFCAYGAFLLFIPMMTLLVDSSTITTGTRVVAALTLMYMVVTVLLFSISRRVKEYHLPFQVAYMGLLHVVILMATYLRVT